MYQHKITLRVCYADIDQMGFVYYGNYARFFEIARVEAIRNLGLSYKTLERQGIVLPVSVYQVKYIKPARYDDLLTIETSINEYPECYKLRFMHTIFNEEKVLLTKAEVLLYILDARTQKPTTLPVHLLDNLKKYFI